MIEIINIVFVNSLDIFSILRRQCRRVPHLQMLQDHCWRDHQKTCFEELASLINCCDNHNKSLFEYLAYFLEIWNSKCSSSCIQSVFHHIVWNLLLTYLEGFKCNQMFLQFFYPKSMGSKVFVWQSGEILIANRIAYLLEH